MKRFDLLLEEYLAARGSAQKQHRSILTRFLVFLRERGVGDIREIGDAHIAAYLHALAGQRTRHQTLLSPVTRATFASVVKVFLGFLQKRKVIFQAPEVPIPRVEKLPRGMLSVSEARRLVEAPPLTTATGVRDRAALEVLYGSGLRAGECSRLDIADLDLHAGTVFVRDGKGRKDRVVPLTPPARAALAMYLAKARPELVRDARHPALFVSWRTQGRLTIAGLQMLVRANGRRAGISRSLSTHILRHACATHMLQGGASAKHIQEILGHKSLRSTMIYTRVEPGDLRAMLRKAHPRERR